MLVENSELANCVNMGGLHFLIVSLWKAPLFPKTHLWKEAELTLKKLGKWSWCCRQDSAVHPKSVHFTWFYITKHMEEHQHWEYWGIEADSRLGPTIRSILVAPTRPLQFIRRNFIKNWRSNAHYKFLVIPAVSLIYLSLLILHQIRCGNLCWSCKN